MEDDNITEPDIGFNLSDDVEIVDLNDLPSGTGGSRLNVETQAAIDAIRRIKPHLDTLPASKAIPVKIGTRLTNRDEKNLKSKVSRLVRVALETLDLNESHAARTHYEIVEKDGMHIVDGYTAFVHAKIS